MFAASERRRTYKTGRLPAVRPASLQYLSAYTAGRLPAPPPSVTPPGGVYPLLGNATYGDCTMAGVCHLIEAWNAETGEHDAIPTEKQVVAEYFKLTGGEDTGLNEANVLKTWQTVGLFGEKITAYAPVNPQNLLALHQAIAFYGGVYLGILCPESAQHQFSEGKPWTYVGEETNDGHCVVAVGYDAEGNLLIKTWGGEAVLTAGFRAHYLQEAWVALPHQIIEAKKGPFGIDVASLQADIAKA